MKIIETTFERLPRERLVIGFEGENQRATVRIDCASVFAEYPNATPSLIVKPLFADAYPVVVDRNGTDVDWLITSEILSFSGDGEIQLVFYKDEVICKSAVSKIRVCRSLQVTGDMPDPVVQWIENANRKLAEVDAQIVELEGMVDTATDAATRAEQSASTSSTKAEQAAGSAATATEKATEATQAAGTATAKAAEAQTAAQTATQKATAAADSERIATAKAVEATTAAGTATTKAEQATEAAQTATEKAGDASASATAAQTSAIDAASSATAASASETAAKASETAASTSASQAAQSVLDAGANAQTAMQKAAEATQSATDAAASATSAATSAETASTKAGEAAQSAQAVAETAEQLADSLEQIGQNTQDIAELDERKANVDGYYPDMTVGNAEQLNSSKFVENSEPYTFRTSGGTSDIGNREYLDAVVGGTVAWNQAVRDEASENSTDFAPIVTVTDAVEDAAGVKVKIEPVQDLHGYENPWPAGGGVNKMPALVPGEYTKDGIKAVVDSSGIVTVTGQKNVSSGTTVILPLEEAFTPVVGQYFHLRNSQVNSSIAISRISGSPSLAQVNRIVQLPANQVEVTSLGIYVTSGVTDTLNFTLQMSIEDSGDVTNWTPYSNICPITGWDGVKVSRTGKNLYRYGEIPVYTYSFVSKSKALTDADNPVLLFGGNTYVLSWQNENPDAKPLVRAWRKNGDLLINEPNVLNMRMSSYGSGNIFVYSTVGFWYNGSIESSTNIAIINPTEDLWLDMVTSSARGINTNVQLELGSTATDYEPYAGNTYDITLPTEAGTVYGGELTVNKDGSGTVESRTRCVTVDSLDWLYQSGGANPYFQYLTQDASTQPLRYSQCRTSIGLTRVQTMNSSTTNDFAIAFPDTGYIRIRDTRYTDVASFVSAYTGVQIEYQLNVPQTFPLTASQVQTLLGTNNVWADTGDLALTYTGTDEHLTLESGKKYLARLSGTDSMLLGSGQEITAAKGTDNVFDLTQMFGTAVADYVYGQGAAFFRKWFPNAVYPYNAGELRSVEGLQSHDMVGFNQWDEEWELGTINPKNGQNKAGTANIRSTNYIPVFPNTEYFSAGATILVFYYDESKNLIRYIYRTNQTFITPDNCRYIRFNAGTDYGTTYKHDICINLSHNGSRNGEYEPYEKHSYPLDSSVILRGIPKVDANGVYWDGDRYLPDGTVERRYGVVDLGTLNLWTYMSNYGYFHTSISALGSDDSVIPNMVISNGMQIVSFADRASSSAPLVCFQRSNKQLQLRNTGYTDVASLKAAMSGVLLVYELATPTTETAQPYHSTQWVSDWGTEEFVSTGIVPVGTETRYPANLRDKLQHLPDAASGNGSYLITQTDGQMVLTPFPAPPSTAGNYVLKATVVDGVATYTWEVAT